MLFLLIIMGGTSIITNYSTLQAKAVNADFSRAALIHLYTAVYIAQRIDKGSITNDKDLDMTILRGRQVGEKALRWN
jgi:hypothetical protein